MEGSDIRAVDELEALQDETKVKLVACMLCFLITVEPPSDALIVFFGTCKNWILNRLKLSISFS